MATSFPTSLDVYTTLVDNVDDVLAAHANDRGDAIEVIEAKVGIDGSAVTTSHDYKLRKLLSEDLTIAGIKTFSSIPVLPASDPTTDNQAVRKAYVDGGSKVKAYLYAGNQNIPNITDTRIALGEESYDTLGEYDATAYKFTASKAGYYMVIGQIHWYSNIVADKTYRTKIYKNGVEIVSGTFHASHINVINSLVVTTVYLAINDYLEMYGYQDSGGTVVIFGSAGTNIITYLSIHRLF